MTFVIAIPPRHSFQLPSSHRPKPHRFSSAAAAGDSCSPASLRPSGIFNRHLSATSENVTTKKSVENVMPIATKSVEDVIVPTITGHEREEIEAELQGKNLLEINYPVGPFGTKEAPAVVRSYYDKRIVGCPGGEGEDEHDVVWFWLEKGKSHECPVCSQFFVLEVVGPGGPPDGHGDDDEDHHHH